MLQKVSNVLHLRLMTVKPVQLDTLWFQSKVSNIVECPTFQGLDTDGSQTVPYIGVLVPEVSDLTGFTVYYKLEVPVGAVAPPHTRLRLVKSEWGGLAKLSPDIGDP